MNENENEKKGEAEIDFAAANEGEQMGLVREFIEFLKYNKKYWMIPLLLSLLGLGALILAGGSAAAPFIYTLF
jgi:hypothetical protein